jgi:hypothetical protein
MARSILFKPKPEFGVPCRNHILISRTRTKTWILSTAGMLGWSINSNEFVDGVRDCVKKAVKDMEDHWVPCNFENPQDPFMKQVCDTIQQQLPGLELAAAEAISLDGDPIDTSG